MDLYVFIDCGQLLVLRPRWVRPHSPFQHAVFVWGCILQAILLSGPGPNTFLPRPILLGKSIFDIEVAAVELQRSKPPVIQCDRFFHICDALAWGQTAAQRAQAKALSGLCRERQKERSTFFRNLNSFNQQVFLIP